MITEKQRENRKNYIGSSDAAAVLGIDRYKTPADVYLEKIGAVESEIEENDAIKVGRYCEDAIIQWFADAKGIKVVRNQFRVHANKITAAHLDAIVPEKSEWLVEVKSTGVTSGWVSDEWGEIETDQVPERVAIQCQHQMAILPGVQVTYVPVLMGRAGFRLYEVPRNQEMIENLLTIEESFWREHVEKQVPPLDSIPSTETLKRIIRVPNKTIRIPDALVVAYQAASVRNSEAEKTKKVAYQNLVAALGDAEAGECALGTYTYFERSRKGYTVDPTTFRKLELKKVAKESSNE